MVDHRIYCRCIFSFKLVPYRNFIRNKLRCSHFSSVILPARYDAVIPVKACHTVGTIVTRARKNGTTAYLAQIILKRDGQVIHQEAKTFDRRPAAAAWIAKREKELARPGEIERSKAPSVTLSDAIDKYTVESLKAIGKTKTQVLRSLKEQPIASMSCESIESRHLVELAQALVLDRQPQTVGNYMSHLASIFTIARPAWGYRLNAQAMEDATAVAKRLGLISKSRERSRRPTLDELEKIMLHFVERQRRRPSSAPMNLIVPFAIFSTRRQEEITRIAWADLDETHSRVLVRDMKNPGEKIGNDVWCDLPEPALRVIRMMPRAKDQIFPYTTDAISAAFTRACHFLAIEDLTFHDLRHDGVSRLFEMGLGIPQAAAVSGHRSWSSLKRYTHIRQSGDKYAGWRWLPPAASVPVLGDEPALPHDHDRRGDEQ